ncbi:hypothetical protein ASC89_22240 [Devosia sp. Root413D1]|uniref:LysR family transcriptional regulator n=1 Tax=Devosia sp. Root413D1 TaxID=1736531 RepID=UPI0006F49899|nr:LysR family transcriptional regulator [Devosia sp. Root413D1]KQW75656.1 hypothetical protein ASC89_22240 [Devosia sp. Root413D1]
MSLSSLDVMGQLTAIRAFDAAARLGSFKRAAAELGVTEGAVSRLIRQLERRAKVELFIRAGRRIGLSDAGRAFADDVGPAFERLRQASARLGRQHVERPLVIAAPATTTLRWLIPRQAGLEAALGGSIKLVSWDRPPDISDPSVSLWLSVGEHSAGSDASYVDIMPESFALVVAGERLTRQPDARAALAGLPRLVSRTRPAIWQDWLREGGTDAPYTGMHEFERMYFTLQAAEAGVGSTIAPLEIIGEALADGRLVAPFGRILRKGSYHLALPPRDRRHPATAAAVKWFRRQGQSGAAGLPACA